MEGYKPQDFSFFHRSEKLVQQIKVGKGSWLGFGTTMLKGSILPQYSVLGAKSLLTKEFITPFSIYAGNPAQAKKKGFFLDKQDCSPEYGMPWGK